MFINTTHIKKLPIQYLMLRNNYGHVTMLCFGNPTIQIDSCFTKNFI